MPSSFSHFCKSFRNKGLPYLHIPKRCDKNIQDKVRLFWMGSFFILLILKFPCYKYYTPHWKWLCCQLPPSLLPSIVHCFKLCDVDSQLEDLKLQCLPWGLISERCLSSIHHPVQLLVWRQCGTSCHHLMWPAKEQHDKIHPLLQYHIYFIVWDKVDCGHDLNQVQFYRAAQ